MYFNRLVTDSFHYPAGVIKNGEIGVEIETEGKNLIHENLPNFWLVHADGSLRGESAEYVLRNPLDRVGVEKALNYLSKKLDKAECNYSWRTSVHVHINMQKETLMTLYNLVCLAILFEDSLSKFSGPSRMGNLFCLRAKDAEFLIDIIKRSVRDYEIRGMSPFRYYGEDIRYAFVNLCALPKYGSLEFRSYKGTKEPKEILDWIDIILDLKKMAKTLENPRQIIEMFSLRGPEGFFKDCFSEKSFELLKEYYSSKELFESMRLVQEIAYSCEWKTEEIGADEEEREEVDADEFEERIGRDDPQAILDEAIQRVVAVDAQRRNGELNINQVLNQWQQLNNNRR